MTDKPKDPEWETGTWEGSRRAQLRTALRLTVRQRLEALESLTETSRHFAQMRGAGEFHYGDQTMHEQPAITEKVGEPNSEYTPAPDAGRYRLHLHGCTPTPLASYLKALAILRLVAEQKDTEARGWWEGEHFVLESVLDEEGLRYFFLDEYRPTPIISPWNAGSGFYSKSGAKGAGVKIIKGSKSDRLDGYRDAIAVTESVIEQLGIEEGPDKKEQIVNLLRNNLSDDSVQWLDAAVVLIIEADRNKVSSVLDYPPLLGSGGNDGNLEFSNNFMQRAYSLIEKESGFEENINKLLDASLFGGLTILPVGKPKKNDGIELLPRNFGQFSPSQVGGTNSTTGFEGSEAKNSWDIVLMVEGALLFSASAVKKGESSHRGAANFPFTVRATAAGSGNIVKDNKAKAETWMPIWNKPATGTEIKALLSEGRVVLKRKVAADGLDFSRAVSLLGVNKGINSFQRYMFLARNGDAHFATPLARFEVPKIPSPDLLNELDRWLYSFHKSARHKDARGEIKRLANLLDNALFGLTGSGETKYGAVQKVLILLGEIQRYAGTSPATQEKVPPVPVLSERWFVAARDNSIEFRIAAALAGLQGIKEHPLPMRVHLSPLDPNQKYPDWLPDGARNHYRTWHHGGLDKNLIAVLEKRLLLAQKNGVGDKPLNGWPGADRVAIAAFLAGETDDNRIAQLVAGLAHCRAPKHIDWESLEGFSAIPAAFSVLKLVMISERQLRRCGLLTDNERISVPIGLVRLLAADRVDDAVRLAQRRLRIAGISPLPGSLGSAGLTGSRLAAALLIPLTDVSVRYLHRAISQQDNKQAS